MRDANTLRPIISAILGVKWKRADHEFRLWIIDDNSDLDGVNLLPHLKGEVSTRPHDALYWRFWKQAVIRAGDWKLMHLGDGTDFLFDLTQPDPETKNLAADHPEKVAELRNKLEAWTQQLRPPGLPKNGIQRERQWYQHYLQHPVASKP